MWQPLIVFVIIIEKISINAYRKERHMADERFIKLVEECDGFEYVQAYRDEVDIIMGGKNGSYWYVYMKDGKRKEMYSGRLEDGEWKDVCVKGSGKREKTIDMPPGSTMEKITEKAYYMQDEDWVKNRKPRPVEDSHPHFHYVYGFGDKALDISEKYGVTIGYNDLKDPDGAFHLRYLNTGADVDAE